MPDDEFEFQVESRLTSHGVYVDEVDESDGAYSITYESVSVGTDQQVPHSEVGRVINVLRDLHADDWAGADIEALVTDLDGDPQGRWYVDQQWLDALHNGEMTEVEFSEQVVGTIEHL